MCSTRRRTSVSTALAAALVLALGSAAGASERGESEDRQPENPGEQAEGAPHGNAYGHDTEPGEPASPPTSGAGNGDGAGAQVEHGDDENIPSGNKGSVKVRSHGAEPHPPRNEPRVDCIFDVLFYGFASSGATATIATHAPTSPTGTQVGDAQSVTWEPAQRQGNEYIDRVTFDLRGIVDSGDFTHHEQQGYHLKLTVENHDRENGDVKHKVFWVDCPPIGLDVEGVLLEAEEPDEVTVDVLDEVLEREDEREDEVDEDDDVVTEVAGVLGERDAAAVAAVAEVAEPRPAAALAVTGIGLLVLLVLALASIGGGVGALRLGRR
jgi:hypothetical protein